MGLWNLGLTVNTHKVHSLILSTKLFTIVCLRVVYPSGVSAGSGISPSSSSTGNFLINCTSEYISKKNQTEGRITLPI